MYSTNKTSVYRRGQLNAIQSSLSLSFSDFFSVSFSSSFYLFCLCRSRGDNTSTRFKIRKTDNYFRIFLFVLFVHWKNFYTRSLHKCKEIEIDNRWPKHFILQLSSCFESIRWERKCVSDNKHKHRISDDFIWSHKISTVTLRVFKLN